MDLSQRDSQGNKRPVLMSLLSEIIKTETKIRRSIACVMKSADVRFHAEVKYAWN